jgi:hypothetical protein
MLTGKLFGKSLQDEKEFGVGARQLQIGREEFRPVSLL